MSPTLPSYATARRHLGRRDPLLKQVMAAVGPCRLQPDPDHFGVLVRSIVAQLISTKAARSIFARLEEALGKVTPAAALAAGEPGLRGAGLSWTKARAVLDLAGRA